VAPWLCTALTATGRRPLDVELEAIVEIQPSRVDQ
jgi:hypothetical protein